ncbi:hypothetical protein GQ457_04G015720 [Hibiscus cannabinus]
MINSSIYGKYLLCSHGHLPCSHRAFPLLHGPPWCGLSIGLIERAKSGGLFGKPNISLRTSWATWCACVSVACSRTVTIC